MTTEQIGNVEPAGDDLPPIDLPEANPILAEIDQLNQQQVGDDIPDVTTESEQPVPKEPDVQDQQVTTPVTDISQEQPSPEPVPQPAPQPQYSEQQMQQMRQQAAQYQEEQIRSKLGEQVNSYKQQLENQGFLPEHADQAANHYMQTQQAQIDMARRAEADIQHVQGQMLVAELFVKKYNLGIEDLTTLRTYNDPQSMEEAAKKLSGDRERDAELTKLRQAQVPAQQFDNSQGEPSVAQNDASWLDRYNSGDRSPNSVAAARRATGLE